MAISNELSSDVAVAILANEKSPQELKKLKDIILEVHSTLQKMSEETRAYHVKKKPHTDRIASQTSETERRRRGI